MALCSPLHAVEWAYFATVSDTLGINTGRVCVGDASKGDIGCPTYAPTVSSAGLLTATTGSFGGLTVTGSVSATNISASALTVNGVDILGDSSEIFTFCTNENSDGDGTDDKAACVGAASNGGEGNSQYRVLSCGSASNNGIRVGRILEFNGTAWRFYADSSGWLSCEDGSTIVASLVATSGYGGGGGGSGTPGGSDTQLQFNNSSAFGGSANLTWTDSLNRLTATNVSATNISATAFVASGGLSAATGAFGGLTVTGASALANVSVTNISVTGSVSAATVVAGRLTATGNSSLANVSATNISASALTVNGVDILGDSSAIFTLCSNENSDGDGTDDVAACVAAASNSSRGTSEYRAINCTVTGNIGARVGRLIDFTGTTWRYYADSAGYANCTDGTTLVVNMTATSGFGGGGGGGGTPGGLTTQIQFNDSGAFGGSENFIWDNSYDRLATTNVSATNISASALTVNGVAITGGGGVSYLTSLTDVSSTGTADNRMLRYSSSSGKWEAVQIQDTVSTSTILANWPDAILCHNSGATDRDVVMMLNYAPNDNGRVAYYSVANPSPYYASFDSGGTYVTGGNPGDCASKTIAQLYSTGQAFNFIGGSGSGGGTPGGSDTQIQFNNSSAFGGSANFTWTDGYNRLTATNISGTTLTATTTSATTITAETVRLSQSSAACSVTSDHGKMRRDPTTGRLQICMDR